MNTHRLLASAAAGALLSLVVPTSAVAVTYVDARAQDVTIRYNDCKTTQVDVSGDWHTDVYNEIRIVVRKPGGAWFDEKTVQDDYDGAVSMTLRLCDEDRAGEYGVDVVAIGYDESYEEVSRKEAFTSFQYTYVPKANSRLRHRVIHTPNKARWKYQVPGQLLRKGQGYRGVRVFVIARISGSWYKIEGQRTGRRGYFGWRFEPSNVRWRYYFAGNRTTEPTVTDIFRTPRPAARTAARSSSPAPDLTVEQVQDLVHRS